MHFYFSIWLGDLDMFLREGEGFFRSFSVMEGQQLTISKLKVCLSVSSKLLKHFMTELEFIHWLTCMAVLMLLLILSRMGLLMRVISLYAGFMSLHGNLFAKFSLWSFSVTNACR